MEVIASRRMVLGDVYMGSSKHPRCAGSEHSMGFLATTSGDVFYLAVGRISAQSLIQGTDQVKERRLQQKKWAREK